MNNSIPSYLEPGFPFNLNCKPAVHQLWYAYTLGWWEEQKSLNGLLESATSKIKMHFISVGRIGSSLIVWITQWVCSQSQSERASSVEPQWATLCCVIQHSPVNDYIHVICHKSNVVTGSVLRVMLGYHGDFALVLSGTAVSHRFFRGHAGFFRYHLLNSLGALLECIWGMMRRVCCVAFYCTGLRLLVTAEVSLPWKMCIFLIY